MELAGGFHTLDGEKSSDLEASDSEASDYGDGAEPLRLPSVLGVGWNPFSESFVTR